MQNKMVKKKARMAKTKKNENKFMWCIYTIVIVDTTMAVTSMSVDVLS